MGRARMAREAELQYCAIKPRAASREERRRELDSAPADTRMARATLTALQLAKLFAIDELRGNRERSLRVAGARNYEQVPDHCQNHEGNIKANVGIL